MFADQPDIGPLPSQHERGNQSQATVTQDDDAIAASNVNLFDDPAGGGERFDEDGRLRGDCLGYPMQVYFRQDNPLRKRAIAAENAQNRPIGTMGPPTRTARCAPATTAVDLADNALPGIAARFSDPDKFMAGNSDKPHVAAQDLQVGFTDPRLQDPDGHFICPRLWIGPIIAISESATVKPQCPHRRASIPATKREQDRRMTADPV